MDDDSEEEDQLVFDDYSLTRGDVSRAGGKIRRESTRATWPTKLCCELLDWLSLPPPPTNQMGT